MVKKNKQLVNLKIKVTNTFTDTKDTTVTVDGVSKVGTEVVFEVEKDSKVNISISRDGFNTYTKQETVAATKTVNVTLVASE